MHVIPALRRGCSVLPPAPLYLTTTEKYSFDSLECKVNYSATSNNMKLVHQPLMGGLLHLVQRGGAKRGGITVLLYDALQF